MENDNIIISRYTRENAIEDGVLIDITEPARETGILIEFIRANPSYGDHALKRIVLANVREVTQGENDVLLTPLIPLGDLHFSLTVACDLARLGAAPEEVAKYLHGNRLRAAQTYISQNGRKIYGPWSDHGRRHEGYKIVPETATSSH